MILMDTHVLVWLDGGSSRMGSNALNLINAACLAGNLAVSAISFWEVAMLVQKGRLEIRLELDVWRRELLDSGLVEIPVQGAIAIRAGGLMDFHGDPADRIIVASAIEMSAELVTADEKILVWEKLSQKIDARE